MINDRGLEWGDRRGDQALSFDKQTTGLYENAYRAQALQLFDQAFELGVIDRAERAKVESPGPLNAMLPLVLQSIEDKVRRLS